MASSESTIETRNTALQAALDLEKIRAATERTKDTEALISSARMIDAYLRTSPAS